MGTGFESKKTDLKNLQELIKTVDPNNKFYVESLKEIEQLIAKSEIQQTDNQEELDTNEGTLGK